MHTEEDTFNALRKPPFSVVFEAAHKWVTIVAMNTEGVTLKEVLAKHHWTVEEWISAYSAYVNK